MDVVKVASRVALDGDLPREETDKLGRRREEVRSREEEDLSAADSQGRNRAR